MGEPHASKLKTSTRILAGLLMLIVGFACIAFVLLLGGALGYAAILPALAGPALAFVGLFQMAQGLRERSIRH